jgi:hypothetical protein
LGKRLPPAKGAGELDQAEKDEEPTLLMAMVEETEDALAPPLTIRSASVEQ